MQDKKLFSVNIPEMLKLTITTGFEALGRSHELAKMDAFFERIQKFLPGEMMLSIFDKQEVKVMLDKYATAIGLDTDGMIPTKEDIDERDEKDQKVAMLEKLMDNPAVQQIMQGQMGGQGGAPQGEQPQ